MCGLYTGARSCLLLDALVLFYGLGRDSRGRLGGVRLLHTGGGGGDSTPGFARGKDSGTKHQGENQS